MCGLVGAALVAGGLAPAEGAAVEADAGTDAQYAADSHVAGDYELTWLTPAAGHVASSALGINDDGDVVGISRPTSAAQPQFTVVWNGDDHVPAQLDNIEGGTFSRGFDLADNDLVVGEAFTSTGSSVPVSWSGGVTPHHIASLNQAGTGVANDVNDAGLAAATAHNGSATRAFVVDLADDSATELDVPAGATVTRATAIADGGEVAGSAILVEVHGDHTHTTTYPAVWDADGQVSVLPSVAEFTYATARGLNSHGVVVGEYQQAGASTAVSWVDEELTPLAPASLPEYPHTTANAVNDGGIVVGGASKFLGNSSFGGAAVAWDGDGAVNLNDVTELPDGVELRSATDVNAAGQIVGSAHTPDGARGFVLTPTEEPHPEALTIDGLAPVYQVGDTITLTARQSPPTSYDDYHWFSRADAGDEWAMLPTTGPTLTETATAQIDGLQVQARLYDHEHTVIATSEPVTIQVAHQDQRHETNLGATAGPAQYGRPTRLELRATSAGAVPDGWVEVRVDGRPLAPATLAHGRATVDLPRTLRAGRHSLQLSYPGNDLFAPAELTRSLRVEKAEAKVTLRVSESVARVRKDRLGARVSVVLRGSNLRPTGPVLVQVDGKTVRRLRLDQAGPRRIEVVLPRFTTVGTARVRVRYLGNHDVRPDSSRPVLIRVVRR